MPGIIVILKFGIHPLRKFLLGGYVYITNDLKKKRKIFKGEKNHATKVALVLQESIPNSFQAFQLSNFYMTLIIACEKSS